VEEHSVASAAIDLLPHPMWLDGAKNDSQMKLIGPFETKSRFDDNNPPLI